MRIMQSETTTTINDQAYTRELRDGVWWLTAEGLDDVLEDDAVKAAYSAAGIPLPGTEGDGA